MRKLIVSAANVSLPLLLSAGLLLSSASAFADPVNSSVKARGTLSGIVDANYPNSELSKAQIMMAILAENPRAFRGGNINFMLRNRELKLPSEDMIAGIPVQNAAALLEEHNRYYRRGQTGNLTPPTFIKTHKKELDKLKNQHQQQTKKVEVLSEESQNLQNLVKQLEQEKQKRDKELKELEDKIETLKESGNGILPGEVTASERMLRDKNEVLQQQLIETKSELFENNRTTIALERRMTELQDRQRGGDMQSNTNASADNGVQQDRQEMPLQEVAEAPSIDLNGNVVETENNQATGFDFSKLTWLIPLVAILVGLGLLLKRIFGRKKHAELNLDDVDEVDFTTPKMPAEQRYENSLEETQEAVSDAPLEVSIKLDVARAYMEAEDNQSAYEMLHEVLQEGTAEQQEEAQELLAKL